MTAGHVPAPLNPRNPAQITRQLSRGNCVRITTTRHPRTLLTVIHVHPATQAQPPRLILTTPDTNPAQESTSQCSRYDCITAPASPTMTVIKHTDNFPTTTTRSLGSLTTIAHLSCHPTPPISDDWGATAEVGDNE